MNGPPQIHLCQNCGTPMTSRWVNQMGVGKTKARNCPQCGIENLARFMEAELPGDSLQDISRGEQMGAWLRDMNKKGK